MSFLRSMRSFLCHKTFLSVQSAGIRRAVPHVEVLEGREVPSGIFGSLNIPLPPAYLPALSTMAVVHFSKPSPALAVVANPNLSIDGDAANRAARHHAWSDGGATIAPAMPYSASLPHSWLEQTDVDGKTAEGRYGAVTLSGPTKSEFTHNDNDDDAAEPLALTGQLTGHEFANGNPSRQGSGQPDSMAPVLTATLTPDEDPSEEAPKAAGTAPQFVRPATSTAMELGRPADDACALTAMASIWSRNNSQPALPNAVSNNIGDRQSVDASSATAAVSIANLPAEPMAAPCLEELMTPALTWTTSRPFLALQEFVGQAEGWVHGVGMVLTSLLNSPWVASVAVVLAAVEISRRRARQTGCGNHLPIDVPEITCPGELA